MRAVIQRVKNACLKVDGVVISEIGKGYVVFFGVKQGDDQSKADYIVRKTAAMRLFEDGNGKMNLSLLDVGGDALVVSQFTLYGSLKKGTRPSFNRSARAEISKPLYEKFLECLEAELGKKVGRGLFGAMMNVSLTNDGPVTIILDSDGA